MKLLKNQKGFNDTITVAIISAFVGAIFIGGAFVWGEVDRVNTLNVFYSRPSKIVKIEKEIKEVVVDYDYSNWLTYTNNELGFEVEYPMDWTIEYSGGYHSIQSSEKAPLDSMAPGSPVYLFNIFTFTDDVDSLILEKTFPITINGVEGIRGRETKMGHYSTVVILQQGNQGFKLSFLPINTNTTIEKILSTFKFLD